MKKFLLIIGFFISSSSYAQIDASIITNGSRLQQEQQARNWAAAENLASNTGGIVFNRRVGQMRQLGTIEEKRAFANKSMYRNYLNRILDSDIAEQNTLQLIQEKHDADIANLKAQTEKINTETQLLLIQSSAPSLEKKVSRGGREEKVYIEYIVDNLYKTDDSRLIKTQSCYEYVYGEGALIMQNKLIFKNAKTCNIEKIMSL